MDEQITPLVMCVDDDELTLELMSRYLQLQGIEVVKATSGIAALNLLAKLGTKVQIIFLDLALPGMTGFQVANAIRHEPAIANLPIVAVTARVGCEVEELAAEAAIDEVVAKPFAPKQLRDILVHNNILPVNST